MHDFVCILFKLIIPITMVLGIFFGLLDQFGWQYSFPVAHFGWWTLIAEAISAGYSKVAAKISNWLGTRSQRYHLSGALPAVLQCLTHSNSCLWVEAP